MPFGGSLATRGDRQPLAWHCMATHHTHGHAVALLPLLPPPLPWFSLVDFAMLASSSGSCSHRQDGDSSTCSSHLLSPDRAAPGDGACKLAWLGDAPQRKEKKAAERSSPALTLSGRLQRSRLQQMEEQEAEIQWSSSAAPSVQKLATRRQRPLKFSPRAPGPGGRWSTVQCCGEWRRRSRLW